MMQLQYSLFEIVPVLMFETVSASRLIPHRRALRNDLLWACSL